MLLAPAEVSLSCCSQLFTLHWCLFVCVHANSSSVHVESSSLSDMIVAPFGVVLSDAMKSRSRLFCRAATELELVRDGCVIFILSI